MDYLAKRHSDKGIINDAADVKCCVMELFHILLMKEHWKGNDPAGEKLSDLLPFFDFNDMKFQPGYRNYILFALAKNPPSQAGKTHRFTPLSSCTGNDSGVKQPAFCHAEFIPRQFLSCTGPVGVFAQGK
ncbi:hypothetical protein J7438_24020 [Thalassotalea sp. G20_0]|uniref:hypothetical protein n=1 Tax=Thalassotalea sp. G20_0 TaxID=2821093 RepID=UPI001ADB05AB|nr:hypothetical protein [Thalassotalea sp. G20_0]MBO9497128.1 hypothetical protein [Thalassotalea sp. G20_0]